MNNNIENDIERTIISREELQNIVKRLGAEISRDYEGKNLLMISVLKGAVVTMADLMRAVTIPCRIDFMMASSYGSGTRTTGDVRILKDLEYSLKDYDILIVEDILDSGITLKFIYDLLKGRGPRSVRICTLLDKPGADRRADIKPDYVGATVPNEFIVGYGLDYAEKYRNLPYIGVLRSEVYAKKDGDK